MKIISQISMLDDTQNENWGELERLQRVIEYMPDEKLIRKLEGIRGKGRNEWPVAAMKEKLSCLKLRRGRSGKCRLRSCPVSPRCARSM